MKKIFFCLVLFGLAAGSARAQVMHHNDDRDLFIGVGSASRIYPNIVILADSSGSMRLVIYHPDYNPRLNYTKRLPEAVTSTTNPVGYYHLDTTSVANVGFGADPDTGLRRFPAFNDFYICRGASTSTWVWDARAQFRRTRSNPYRWQVWKSTVEGTLAPGQFLTYDGNGSGLNDHTTIESIDDGGTVWDLYINQSQMDGVPNAGAWIYVNYRQETHVSDTNARFVETEGECAGAEETIPVSLYGNTWTQTGHTYYTDYEYNYLYWLAFHASPEQAAEVTHWAETGSFRNDANGNPIYSGFYRMQVAKDVLKEVLNEIWAGDTNYNFGLYRFDAASAGAEQLNNLQNANSPGVENAFRNSIDAIQPQGSTPLAEALADIWVYFKEGQSSTDYEPNGPDHVLSSGCGFKGGSGFPAASCPIQYECQKNYVIVMTDGSATHDNFGESKYTDAANNIFLQDVSVWGDGDNHDPAHHGDAQPTTGLAPNPDGTEYCPEASCWSQNLPGWGTDYLDDVSYYLYHNDLFPNTGPTDLFPDMPGIQNIETFTIGFTVHNDLLRDTAVNGNLIGASAYYTSNDYKTLKDNLIGIINNISLREFGFSSITAPKKLTTTVGEGHSFVGYFMPNAQSAIWTGHLQSYLLTDKYHVDLDRNGKLEGPPDHTPDEFVNPYSSLANCQQANPGETCLRSILLGGGLGPEEGGYVWDAKDEMVLPRNLFTHDGSSNIPFTIANLATLQPLFQLAPNFDPAIPEAQATSIINKLNTKVLGDIFHSDIAYVGAPLSGKKFLKNLNPAECGTTTGLDKAEDDRCFEWLLASNVNRRKVVYVGTNEGILHQVDANTGVERWGFIPDEVLPNLKKIVIDNQYAYTVDGRLMAEDIYYRGATAADNEWRTILTFGLKDGGNSFYTLNITDASAEPTLLWKFNDADYSGKSWSKPYIGKIRYSDGTTTYDRWVVIVAGGMAFNNLDSEDTAGKAVFVIDASSGELIWMIGYNGSTGAADANGTVQIDTNTVGVRRLTAKTEFNYPIPSSIIPVDRDSDGYLDAIYFGNVAGYLFKTDISSILPANWKSYLLFSKENPLAHQATNSISSISGNVITLAANNNGFALHNNVFQPSTGAMGTIDMVNNRALTVTTISPAAFAPNREIVVPGFDPIFLSPTVFFDNCYNLWVGFGTGDRIRSRTNPDTGGFIALRDGTTVVSSATVQKTNLSLADMVPLSWTEDTATNTWNIAETNIKVADKWGWQFTFPMADNHEKLFDPEPIVLPDANMVPHIYFNTYQPSPEGGSEDCAAPKNGLMYFYDVTNNYCGSGTVSGDMESGRIAGGGVFQGSDYILYEGTGDVASIPPMQNIKPIKLIYTGGLLFWKEKKR